MSSIPGSGYAHSCFCKKIGLFEWILQYRNGVSFLRAENDESGGKEAENSPGSGEYSQGRLMGSRAGLHPGRTGTDGRFTRGRFAFPFSFPLIIGLGKLGWHWERDPGASRVRGERLAA